MDVFWTDGHFSKCLFNLRIVITGSRYSNKNGVLNAGKSGIRQMEQSQS